MSNSKRNFGKGEIADAHKRFNASELETQVQRFELEDKPTPQEQKENLADLILKQRDEITTLRQQLEQAEARCAELEAAGDVVTGAVLTSTRLFELRDDKLTDAMDQWQDVSRCRTNMSAFILRAQADAVEAIKDFKIVAYGSTGVAVDVYDVLKYGQRLRNQADEIERGGCDE